MAAFCLGCFITTDAERVGVDVPEDEGEMVLFCRNCCCLVAVWINFEAGETVDTGELQTGGAIKKRRKIKHLFGVI
jgi:hypothetical protein